jgi:AcrR family transcriptional regulator
VSTAGRYHPPVARKTTADAAPAPATKSERTRERLINAAAVTLSRLGYAGTRLVDVAEEAGLQAPAIYYYFESREQLIEEVVVVGTVRLRDHVVAELAAAPAGASPLDRLDIAIAAHLRQLMSDSSFAHAVIRNQSQLPEPIRRRQQVEERRYTAIWRGLFRDLRAAGDLRADIDPDLAYLLVTGSLNWATEWWTPRRGSLDSVIAAATTLAHHGISPRPSP